jgi:hypothetical protein
MQGFNLLKANIRMEYIEYKRYLPNTIAMLLTFYIIFIGMFAGIQLIGDPTTQDSNSDGDLAYYARKVDILHNREFFDYCCITIFINADDWPMAKYRHYHDIADINLDLD